MIRVYLTSEVRVEHGDALLRERDLPGRQGRVLLAMLVDGRDQPLSRETVAAELWPEDPPPAWEKAVMALVSKLRAAFRDLGLPDDTLTSAFGCYQLRLPADTWVDVESSADAVHRAEALLANGDWKQAYPWAAIGYFIGRRALLAGEEGPWVTRRRLHLRDLYLRALDCCVECCSANGELAEAVQRAEDALALEPYREATYRRLMQALAGAGNRAEALRVYERCRALLDEELGVPPSKETEAVFTEILRA